MMEFPVFVDFEDFEMSIGVSGNNRFAEERIVLRRVYRAGKQQKNKDGRARAFDSIAALKTTTHQRRILAKLRRRAKRGECYETVAPSPDELWTLDLQLWTNYSGFTQIRR